MQEEVRGRLLLGERFANQYLTGAELNVLKNILVCGERAVARELGISRSTVSTHVQNIKKKFSCSTILELRKLVIENGLVHDIYKKNI